MKTVLLCLISVLLTPMANAEPEDIKPAPKCVELLTRRSYPPGIQSVSLADQQIRDGKLILSFDLETVGGLGDTVGAVELVSAQSSVESRVNFSQDFYFRTQEGAQDHASAAKPQIAALMPSDSVRFEFVPIRLANKGMETIVPAQLNRPYIAYLNFDGGMLQGFNTWKMYRLEVKEDLTTSFELVKTYAYVQGKAVEL